MPGSVTTDLLSGCLTHADRGFGTAAAWQKPLFVPLTLRLWCILSNQLLIFSFSSSFLSWGDPLGLSGMPQITDQ